MSVKTLFLAGALLGAALIAPPLNTPAGIYGDPQLLIPFGCCVFFLGAIPQILLGNRWLSWLGALLALSIVMASVSVMIEGLGNVYGLLRLAKALVMYTGLAILTNRVMSQYGAQAVGVIIAKAIYLLITLNGIVMVGQFFSPSFNALLKATTLAGSYSNIVDDPTADYRMSGLSLSGGAQVSLFQSIAVVLFPVFFVSEKSRRWAAVYLIGLLINCFAMAISGRSGMYNITLMLPLMMFMLLADRRFIGERHFMLRVAQVVAAIVILTTAVIFAAKNQDLVARIVNDNFAKAIERNGDFLSSDNERFLENSTIDLLWSSHLVFPETVSEWVFGRPEVMESRGIDRQLDSDIGYIVTLNAFGIFGVLLQTAVVAAPAILAAMYRRRALLLAYIVIAVSGSVLFFNAKEVVFFARMSWPIQCVAWCAFVYMLQHSYSPAAALIRPPRGKGLHFDSNWRPQH